jgi:carboxyl-terminal processing protease
MTHGRFRSLVAIVVPMLAACGGGGSGGGNANGSAWVAGVFQPADDFVAQCANPRSGTDPITGDPFPDKQGSTLTQNNWLRSWSNDLYLWYNEIVDRNPAISTTPDYFNQLKTPATTASGAPKDRFHFTMATSDWEALAQSGVSPGYGATWVVIAATPPRQIVVAYTDPNTPATDPSVNLARGATVLMVDGVDAVNDDTQQGIDTLNEALFPTQINVAHTFTVRDAGVTTLRVVTMTAVDATSTPVQHVSTVASGSGLVGYMLFNDHLATAEQELINAIDQLATAGVTDLVLDIRYNGGGFLDIASELAFMIAGPTRTAGKTFELTVFNNKHATVDPVTGQTIVPLGFHSESVGLSAPAGQALPTLNLARVFVLTGSSTCSASESIINSLQGIDVDVIQIGSKTCGKPYGFYPQDNCGTTYFSIEFQGENAKGFGNYPDGFSPANTAGSAGAAVTGCSVADDFTHQLGDPLEGRLAAALAYRQTTTCPAPSGFAPPGRAADTFGTPLDGVVQKSVWQQNRIMRR